MKADNSDDFADFQLQLSNRKCKIAQFFLKLGPSATPLPLPAQYTRQCWQKINFMDVSSPSSY